MEDSRNISEDLLVKFINCDTTPKEYDMVLDYLSASDENLDDFLTMCAALESHWNAEKVRRAIQQRHSRRKFIGWISAAAAVALIVLAGTYFIRNSQQDDGQNGMIAQQEQPNDTIVEKAPAPSVTDPVIDTKEETQSYFPQKESPKLYADSIHKHNYATMVYPIKSEISVENKRSITLRWSTDAVNAHIKISDDNGTLVNEDLGTAKMYHLQTNGTETTYYWHITFELPDRTTIEKSGKITNTAKKLD